MPAAAAAPMIMGVSLPLPLPALALVLLLVLVLLLLLLIAGPYVPRSALGLARRVKGGEPQLTKRQIAIAQAAVAGVEQGQLEVAGAAGLGRWPRPYAFLTVAFCATCRPWLPHHWWRHTLPPPVCTAQGVAKCFVLVCGCHLGTSLRWPERQGWAGGPGLTLS